MKGPATAMAMSPEMPLPPMPSTTTFSISSWSGRPTRPAASPAAAST
jgi:hypothetical protein